MSLTKSVSRAAGPAAVLLSAVTLAACGGGGGNAAGSASAKPETAGGLAATLGVASNGSLGEILVDSQGRTLYLFQKDSGPKSACFGACAVAWPPLRVTGKAAVGSGLTASKVGTTARSDGKPQVTYNGHPLYLYQGDQKAGQANGQAIDAFGGGWFALSPAGNTISGTGTSSGGRNGY